MQPSILGHVLKHASPSDDDKINGYPINMHTPILGLCFHYFVSGVSEFVGSELVSALFHFLFHKFVLPHNRDLQNIVDKMLATCI